MVTKVWKEIKGKTKLDTKKGNISNYLREIMLNRITYVLNMYLMRDI